MVSKIEKVRVRSQFSSREINESDDPEDHKKEEIPNFNASTIEMENKEDEDLPSENAVILKKGRFK